MADYFTNLFQMVYIRKIMCRSGLSSKRPQQVYINRAGKKSIQDWQYRLKRRIPCLEGAGFAAAMQGRVTLHA